MRLLRVGLIASAFVFSIISGTGHAADPCTVPPALVPKAAAPERLSGKLATNRPALIVVLGSSSTAGHAASTPEHTIPNQLKRRLGHGAVEVLNKGVNGQLAGDMVNRLHRDAIALNPDLVIWQTGTNDALKRIDLDVFKDQIQRGLKALADAGIDVILIDPQFFPGIRDVPAFETYVTAMHDLAASGRVALLPRYAIMRHWAMAEAGPDMLAGDRFHMNDLGYACIAELLADLIRR